MNVNDSEKESYDNNSRRKTEVLNGTASASLRALPDNDANSFTDTGTETLKNIIILSGEIPAPPATYLAEFKLNGNIDNTGTSSITGTNYGVTFSGDYGQFLPYGGSSHISLTNDGTLDFTVPFAVECEVQTPYFQNMVFVGTGSHGGAGFNGYQLGMEADGKYNFSIGKNSWAAVTAAKSTTISNDGNWHKLRGVWDGTTINLYVDDILQEFKVEINPPTYINTSPEIGVRQYSPGLFIEYTYGNIRNVRFELL